MKKNQFIAIILTTLLSTSVFAVIEGEKMDEGDQEGSPSSFTGTGAELFPFDSQYIFNEIAQSLSLEDLHLLSQTCKRAHQFVRTYLHRVTKSFNCEKCSPAAFKTFLDNNRSVRFLTLEKANDSYIKILNDANLIYLSSLNLEFRDDSILSHLRPTSILILSTWTSELTADSIQYLPRGLTSLDLSGCCNLRGRYIKGLPSKLDFTGACFKDLPKGLISLNLSGCKLSDYCIPLLPRGLTSLNLSGCYNLTDECVSQLKQERPWLSIEGVLSDGAM